MTVLRTIGTRVDTGRTGVSDKNPCAACGAGLPIKWVREMRGKDRILIFPVLNSAQIALDHKTGRYVHMACAPKEARP